RSVRHSLASSTAARRVLSGNSPSFFSNRSSSANASAAEPAKPTRTFPPGPSRRIFVASALATTFPSVTCPSPPSATSSPRRTLRMVVDLAAFIRTRYILTHNAVMLNIFRDIHSGPLPPLTAEEADLSQRLRRHVDMLARVIGERNIIGHPHNL